MCCGCRVGRGRARGGVRLWGRLPGPHCAVPRAPNPALGCGPPSLARAPQPPPSSADRARVLAQFPAPLKPAFLRGPWSRARAVPRAPNPGLGRGPFSLARAPQTRPRPQTVPASRAVPRAPQTRLRPRTVVACSRSSPRPRRWPCMPRCWPASGTSAQPADRYGPASRHFQPVRRLRTSALKARYGVRGGAPNRGCRGRSPLRGSGGGAPRGRNQPTRGNGRVGGRTPRGPGRSPGRWGAADPESREPTARRTRRPQP